MKYAIVPALPVMSSAELAARTDASRNAARDTIRTAYYTGGSK